MKCCMAGRVWVVDGGDVRETLTSGISHKKKELTCLTSQAPPFVLWYQYWTNSTSVFLLLVAFFLFTYIWFSSVHKVTSPSPTSFHQCPFLCLSLSLFLSLPPLPLSLSHLRTITWLQNYEIQPSTDFIPTTRQRWTFPPPYHTSSSQSPIPKSPILSHSFNPSIQ